MNVELERLIRLLRIAEARRDLIAMVVVKARLAAVGHGPATASLAGGDPGAAPEAVSSALLLAS